MQELLDSPSRNSPVSIKNCGMRKLAHIFWWWNYEWNTVVGLENAWITVPANDASYANSLNSTDPQTVFTKPGKSTQLVVDQFNQENEETSLLYFWNSIYYVVARRVSRTLAATTPWRRIQTTRLCINGPPAIRNHTRRSQHQGSRRLYKQTPSLIEWKWTRQEEHLSEGQKHQPLIPFHWEKASQH